MIACLLLLAAPALGAPVDSAVHAWIGDLEPLAEAEFGYEQAAHLLERVGFGGTPAQIEELVSLGLEGAVTRLVDYEQVDDSDLPPFDESGIWDRGMDPFPASRAQAVRIGRRDGRALGVDVLAEGSSRPLQPVVDKFFYGLRSNVLETRRLALWWGKRMVTTPRPLEEKMTLFWHDHFATSEVKVRDVRKMHLQNRTLRAHATGDFRSLVLAVMRDPAMLVYLDNRENVKDHPNENFGRELLELFTDGPEQPGKREQLHRAGHPRSLPGLHRLDQRRPGVPVRCSELHDDGAEDVSGTRPATLNGEDMHRHHPRARRSTAEYISAASCIRYFVREEVD